MKKTALFGLIMALVLVSCKSQEVTTEEQVDYTAYFEKQEQRTDSMFAALKLQQARTTEKLSNLKVENTTTYYTLPDSTGRQYPVYVSTTKANKEDKEQEQVYTVLNERISRMQVAIDSLTNAVTAFVQKKEDVQNISWWDLHKGKIYAAIIAVAIIGLALLIYKLRKK